MEEEFSWIFKNRQLFDILLGNNLKVSLDNPHLDFYSSNFNLTLETSLICNRLSVSRNVHFDKRMIYFLSCLL